MSCEIVGNKQWKQETEVKLIRNRLPVQQQQLSSVFRILILWVPSVNRIFPLRVLTAGAISLFLNITRAKYATADAH